MKNLMKKMGLLGLLIVTFIACDKDYNAVGTDLLTHSNFITDSVEFPALTYNKVVEPVKSNNLTSSLLGIYDDPTYGKTAAQIVTQLIPTTYSPDFGDEPVIDSIIITIPYFSHKTGETDDDGNALYELDSLFGNAETPIKLSIYQNTYFLRSYDPETNLEEAQKYYSNSNQTINFNDFTGQLLYENGSFVPKASEISIGEYDEEGAYQENETLAPAFRVDLLKDENGEPSDELYTFWKNLLIDQEGQTTLSNANNFVDYFRGIYLKTETAVGFEDGQMLMLDFANKGANITVYSSYLYNTADDGTEDIRQKEFKMNLSGNKINVIENNLGTTLVDGDEVNGDELIYLKGMEGSMGIVKLFGNLDEVTHSNEALDNFRETFGTPAAPKRLINEANLVVYVDQDMITNGEPDRLMLYDLKNNIPVIDYYADPTVNTNSPLYSRIIHSKILQREEVEDANGYKKGIKYKFRITEHLNNILLRDSTNYNLGLVVTTNVNSIDPLDLYGTIPNDENPKPVGIPLGAFLSPRGTVLYGSNPNVPEEKRIKLEIFYSEPEN